MSERKVVNLPILTLPATSALLDLLKTAMTLHERGNRAEPFGTLLHRRARWALARSDRYWPPGMLTDHDKRQLRQLLDALERMEDTP